MVDELSDAYDAGMDWYDLGLSDAPPATWDEELQAEFIAGWYDRMMETSAVSAA